jgi:SPP1 family phage portal protein
MSFTNIPTSVLSGRSRLYTNLTVDGLTAEAIKADLARVLPMHAYNRRQIRQLQEYLRGWHPAINARLKTTRTDVDNKITVDYAYSITRDIVGYFLGKPIQYTNRQGKFRKQMENFVNALNAENKALVDIQIAEDCSICGVGFRGCFTEQNPVNGTKLNLLRLDPMNTFVVYPADPSKLPIYAVTSYEGAPELTIPGAPVNGPVYYKVYTPTKMFVFKDNFTGGYDPVAGGALELQTSTDISFGGWLPIVEYQNNLWRLGDWEMATSIMDALDAVTSDGVNDIQQAVNSILVAMGMELGKDDFDKLSLNGFLNVANIPPGVTPVVDFISQPMNADIGVALRDYLESTLRVIVGVPDRKTRGGGGGDTGDAVFLRDGWQDIDLVAAAKEPYFIQSERNALAVILYILDVNKEVSNINAADVDIHFNRNKTANLQSKAQVFQILSGSAAMAPEDALDIAGLTNNVSDVIMRMDAIAKENAAKAASDLALIQASKGTTDKPNSSEGGQSQTGNDGGTAVS